MDRDTPDPTTLRADFCQAPVCPCAEDGWEVDAPNPDGAIGGTLLSATNLVKRFAGEAASAVHGVSLDVREGEVLALLGPSGCGKTTTLRAIGGFETPDAGRVTLAGRDITDLPPEARGIGFVFQDYALFPHLTVAQNVAFGLRGLSRAETRARVAEMLRLVGLGDLGERRIHQLSGGQQQRVALARTLAPAPKLVLLDEPFSNLDAAMRVETRQEVRRLLKATGAAAILVTHDQEEALALADRVAVMANGTIRQIGTPAAVYRHPACSFVAGFMGRCNMLQAEGRGAMATTPYGPMQLCRAAQGPLNLALRPEQIVLSPDSVAPQGTIVGREFRGHDQLYWVEAGERRLLVLSGPNQSLDVGTPVRLSVSEPVAAVEAPVPG
jgi:iron(III) transport system ATP-binding protein